MAGYPAVDSAELHNMYLTSIAKRGTAYAAGNVLKIAVRKASSHDELDAIIDTR